MRIVTLPEVQSLISAQDARLAMRQAFAAYHRGDTVAPEEFVMSHPSAGDIHGKGAHIKGGEWMVLKVASAGFEQPGNHGCVLGINATTGEIEVLVQDDGWLTEIRTAAAVALSVELLSRNDASRLAIIGAGIQAGFQLEAVRELRAISDVRVTSRNHENALLFAKKHTENHEGVRAARTLHDAVSGADIVLVATSSRSAVIDAPLEPGVHVTASGADMVGKCEIAPAVVSTFDHVVVDDVALARRVGVLQGCDSVTAETLGELIARAENGEGFTRDRDARTLVGLSGLGVQDAPIFELLMRRLG